MNWIDEELDREQEAQHASQSPPSEQEIAEAVRSWWRWFGDALKGNCVEAREHAIPASFSEPAPERYRVANSEAGLAVDFALDEQIRSVHFDYSSSIPTLLFRKPLPPASRQSLRHHPKAAYSLSVRADAIGLRHISLISTCTKRN